MRGIHAHGHAHTYRRGVPRGGAEQSRTPGPAITDTLRD